MLVLTFIGSGCSLFAYILMGLLMPMLSQSYFAGDIPVADNMRAMYEMLFKVPRVFYILSGVCYGLSLVGAALMWNQRVWGFHAYTIAQIVILALPVVYMGNSFFNVGDAMITLLFVAYYYWAMRKLWALPDSKEVE